MKKQYKMTISIFVLLLTALISNGCQATPATQSKTDTNAQTKPDTTNQTQNQTFKVAAEIPISYPNEKTPQHNTFIFPVRLESKEFQFSVDTGATKTIVDLTMKPLLGELVGTRKPDHAFHGGELEFYRTKKPLDVGGVVLQGIFACKDIHQLAAGSGLDGLLGQDVMEKAVVQIDFEKDLFRIIYKPPSDFKAPQEWGFRVPLKQDSVGFYCLDLELIEGQTRNFILDTGILGPGLLQKELFDKQKDTWQLKERRFDKYPMITLPEVLIGNNKASGVDFIAYPESELTAGKPMVGMQFLKTFKMVTINLGSEEMYLLPFSQSK